MAKQVMFKLKVASLLSGGGTFNIVYSKFSMPKTNKQANSKRFPPMLLVSIFQYS